MDDLVKKFNIVMNKFSILKYKHKKITELSNSEFFMLYIISNCIEQKRQESLSAIGVTASEILENMECTMSAVSKLLRVLEKKEYICRLDCKEDRRITYLILSEKGEKLLEKAKQERNKIMMHIVNELGVENMTNLVHILERLCDIMNKEMEEKEQT